MSIISMKQLLEAGVHFGHQSKKWNPKMKKYIFTARNNIHIINLEETSLQIDKAYAFIKEMVALGKSVLFVGTKKQAMEAIKEEAERCGMFYVNNRWLGGTLTNFKTIKSRIERLNKLTQMEKVGEMDFLPKKEVIGLKTEKAKLEKNLNGIKEMRDYPGVIFLIDPTKEHICVREAAVLKIPVVAIVDTNGDPSGIDYVIPANDDALRSVKLITSAVADAIIEAKEGISLNKEKSPEEDVDIKTALVEALSTMEITEPQIEEETKNFKQKKSKPVRKPLRETNKIEEKQNAEKSNEDNKLESEKIQKLLKDTEEKEQEKDAEKTNNSEKIEKVKKEETKIKKPAQPKKPTKSEPKVKSEKPAEVKVQKTEKTESKQEVAEKPVKKEKAKSEEKAEKPKTSKKNIAGKNEKEDKEQKLEKTKKEVSKEGK